MEQHEHSAERCTRQLGVGGRHVNVTRFCVRCLQRDAVGGQRGPDGLWRVSTARRICSRFTERDSINQSGGLSNWRNRPAFGIGFRKRLASVGCERELHHHQAEQRQTHGVGDGDCRDKYEWNATWSYKLNKKQDPTGILM
jgi:hypothetical protein